MPQNPFLGEIFAAGYNFAPQGYALCDGTLLAIVQNTALFSLIGTAYGGNGINTFALPDLRSRVPLMFGQGPGLTPYNLGESDGHESITLLLTEMPAHTHQPIGSNTNGTSTSPANGSWAKSSQADKIYGIPGGAPMNAQALSITGNNEPHENRQPFLALNYYIALQGIFPSRS